MVVKAIIIELGTRFGRLTVIRSARNDNGGRLWLCWCDCGKTTIQPSSRLRSGNTRSCGCLRKEEARERGRELAKAYNTKHGMSSAAEYYAWRSMKNRCCNPRTAQYEDYGGRGITVCQRWLDSFKSFFADVGPRPTGMTLDRIDTNGNYVPGNVRWASRSTQQFNQRKQKGTSSAFRGVHLEKRTGKWTASICKEYRHYRLGTFTTEVEAARAYDAAALRLHGRTVNFPSSNPEQKAA